MKTIALRSSAALPPIPDDIGIRARAVALYGEPKRGVMLCFGASNWVPPPELRWWNAESARLAARL